MAEIAADFTTTFYHVQVGALETEEFEASDGISTEVSDRFGSEFERKSDDRLRTPDSDHYEDDNSVHLVSVGFQAFRPQVESKPASGPQKLAGLMTGRSIEE